MKILVDANEHDPLPFQRPIEVVRFHPPDTGDYSVEGLERILRVERKRCVELWGSLGARREHFRDQLRRLSPFPIRILLIEGTPLTLRQAQPPQTKLSWETVAWRLASWTMEFGVPVWWMGERTPESCRVVEDFLIATHHHWTRNRAFPLRWASLWRSKTPPEENHNE